jgi:glycerol-3-phosphate dehydrogenase
MFRDKMISDIKIPAKHRDITIIGGWTTGVGTAVEAASFFKLVKIYQIT